MIFANYLSIKLLTHNILWIFTTINYVYMRNIDFDKEKERFGKRLKAARKEKRFSQEQLAKDVKVSPGSIGLYERGKHLPGGETLLLLSYFLNKSLSELFDEKKNKQVKKDVISLILKFEKLKAYDKKTVHVIIDALLEQNRKDELEELASEYDSYSHSV